jgi:NitT/TauT family transport system ATP-binding protein
LNDAQLAGESGRLDVRIAHKAFRRPFGERLDVLDDIAFTLRRGEVGGFIGPSGCGKTTMLRIIAGLDSDYRGAVGGGARRPLGMVFQEPRLLTWRTVDENVRLVAPRASEAALAALSVFSSSAATARTFPASCRSAWHGASHWQEPSRLHPTC